MYGYKVNIRSNVVESEYSNEPYGPWHTRTENSFGSVFPDENYPDLVSPLKIEPCEECYVVWAVWSSGDSFGDGIGANYECFGIFKDELSAELLQEHLGDRCTEKLTTDDGQSFEYSYYPWDGYFDGLDTINISRTIMRKGE